MNILLIEDEKEMREMIMGVLEQDGFRVAGLPSTSGAIGLLERTKFDLIVLDQVLPGVSGLQFLGQLKAMREFADIPVMMITGLDGERDQIRAFEMGADDYIVKPFFPKALVARIRAILRRTKMVADQREEIQFGNVRVDLGSHQVFMDGNEVPLTLTEFKILSELLREDGKVLSRDRLRERALGNLNVTDRTIDVHMASLRKKLPATKAAIQTVRGVGYRIASAI